jgi:hypothetical protein
MFTLILPGKYAENVSNVNELAVLRIYRESKNRSGGNVPEILAQL